MIQIDVFQFAKATKKNTKNSNNMEGLTLQVDGPITGRVIIPGGGLITGIFFSVNRLMGLSPEGLITGILRCTLNDVSQKQNST